MKKFLALLLSVVMVLSLSVTAFAAEITITDTEAPNNSTSTDVKGNYKPTYVVTINNSENGKVTAEKANYAAGETVILTVAPNAGYALDTLTVKDTSDSAVEVSEANTFTMPASNVTVTATFKETVVNAVITGMSVNVTDKKNYDDATKTYTVSDDATITITVSGTDFDMPTEANVIKYGNTTVKVTEMTVDTANNKATLTLKGSDLKNMGVVTFSYANDYSTEEGANPKWTDCETKVQYQAPTISVAISWGSMSFTYSDVKNEEGVEAGWSCADGANKVTVANKSEVTVSAAVKYTTETDYDSVISGSFDASSATLNAGANKEFTLTLEGKPAGELDNAKIGTVTVTIAEPRTIEFKLLDSGYAVTATEGMTLREWINSSYCTDFYATSGYPYTFVIRTGFGGTEYIGSTASDKIILCYYDSKIIRVPADTVIEAGRQYMFYNITY